MSQESEFLEAISSALSSGDQPEIETETEKEKKEESPFDMETLMKLGSLMGDFNSDDDRLRLLKDLKPFLSNSKKETVDKAVKILKLIAVAEKLGIERLI